MGARMIAQGNNVYVSRIDIDKNTGQKQKYYLEKVMIMNKHSRKISK